MARIGINMDANMTEVVTLFGDGTKNKSKSTSRKAETLKALAIQEVTQLLHKTHFYTTSLK